MTQPQVLAIDLGTSGVKVAIVDHTGRITGWAFSQVPLQVLPGGGAEQNPADWWSALATGVAALGRAHPDQLAAVRTICTSAQGEGTIAVDAAGRPLTGCLTWLDMRGAANLRRQFAGRVHWDGLSIRRIARWIRLTGGVPSPTGKDPAAHMLWIRDELPEVYARTAVFLNVLDWLNAQLTGQVAATVDSILTSWVTDNRDPRNIRYHSALVADCGIDPDKLPPIVPCAQVLGRLRPQAAEQLGLGTHIQVVAGAIDTSVAALGAGTVDPGIAHLYLGTSSWIAAHMGQKKTDPRTQIASVPCALGDRYLMTALQATAGANLTWLRDQVIEYDDSLLRGGQLSVDEDSIFEAFDVIVPTVPAGSGGVMFTPWLSGERSPVGDRLLRATFVNISLDTSRSALLRAVFEGVALNTRWLMAPVQRFLNQPLAELVVAGGGAQSSAWCQIFADVLGLPVRRVTDPVQVNVRGAGLLGAVGIGAISAADIPGLIELDRTFVPNPAHREVYDGRFADYRRLHRALAPVYRKLNGSAAP